MGLLASLGRLIHYPSTVKAAEGEYRPGPYNLIGGTLSAEAGRHWNWWQMGHSLAPYAKTSAMVEACVSAYAQTVAMCPGDHWRLNPNGGRERVDASGSALARFLRSPNDYQSISDFMMNLTRDLYFEGEAFALARTNARYEISEMHLMSPRQSHPRIAEDGSIFYALAGNDIAEARFGPQDNVPAREVLHVRLHTPVHPLKGVTPLLAAALDVAGRDAMAAQQLSFYLNQARPSFAAVTDLPLSEQQTNDLTAHINNKASGLNQGSTMVFSHGLKPVTLSTGARDAQLAEIMKMSDQNIALAFRVPLQILGSGDTPFASTEALMQMWLASGLGFALNHIEEAIGRLFKLGGVPKEYVEFDTSALLRSSFRERIEGLSKATISGIYSPDESRAMMELPAVAGGAGKEPRVQQQVVPLSYGLDMKPPSPTAPAPALPAPDDEPDEDEEETSENAQRLAPAAVTARLDALLH